MTIVEVMISLMVFSVVLTAIASSWFSLRSLQRHTQDEAKVHELAQALGERIVGANWDWIGRDRPDEEKTFVVEDESVVPQTNPKTMKNVVVSERYWRRYAWSWHRREYPRNDNSSTKTRLPPMTDHDWTDAELSDLRTYTSLTSADFYKYDPDQPVAKRINPHNLVDLGFLDRRTSLENLRVYVEYYQSTMLDDLFVQPMDSTIFGYFKNVAQGQKVGGVDKEMLLFPESPFVTDALETQMNTADQTLALKAMVVRIIVTWGILGTNHRPIHRHELVMARRK